METMYFVLGMLSIAGAAFVATTVWGMVKITKLLKAIKQQEEWIMNNDRNMYENIHRMREEFDRRSDDFARERDKRTEELQREIDKRTEDLHRDINDDIKNVTSYVDSRIDKVSATLKEKKQLLKD
jgi:DNA anti-recombination protein RmuC